MKVAIITDPAAPKAIVEQAIERFGRIDALVNNASSKCVAPGVTMTAMVAHRFEDETFNRSNVETTPYPRLAQPDDIASFIAFLCLPGSKVTSGQSIVVDGGRTAIKYVSPRATRTL